MVKEGDYEPLNYLQIGYEYIKKKLDIYLSNKLISYMIYVIKYYLPSSLKKNHSCRLFDILKNLINKDTNYINLIKNLINYLLDLRINSHKSVAKIICEILEIELEPEFDDTNNSSFECFSFLDDRTRERLANVIYEDLTITSKEKEYICERIFYKRSQKDLKFLHEIQGYDDTKRKELWDLFVFKDHKYTDEKLQSLMNSFNNKEVKISISKNLSNYEKLFKKNFFSDFPYVCRMHSKDYAEMFYKCLKPLFIENKRKLLKKYIEMKKAIKMDDYDHPRLKFMIEKDIKELKRQIIIMDYTDKYRMILI
jgi:hypothetical protein